ncbi:MAG: pyridoxal phosphate-dependent aminotransferase [Candidatus Marinimicrobia bacterium]|nr:pyridoxal phosphate-dependent aminotransferase [Candidatus Neomarinimicrobiota bacterium]|tara:strand:- start:1884 stop:3002 length:1119 start_codon:yes stop_codon:yes gene_type:complete
MRKRIWLSSPHIGEQEQKYVQEAFSSNWIAPLGPNVDNFEKDIIKYTGVKFASALSSGTSAIHLALILMGVKRHDEVICSTFTFSASVNPICYLGATPILVDSESNTWNMCPYLLEESIKDRISKGKKPKAIIIVHLYGMPANMNKILSISDKYNIPVIEDAAESLGSTYNKKHTGSMGEIGVYSFNGNKIITTSGGGMLVSNNEDYCKKSTHLATQARENYPHYEHKEVGYNYRMSNVLAGIGRGQIEVLNQRIESRRNNHEFYRKKISEYGISFLDEPLGYFSNRWLTCIVTNSFKDREAIRLSLEEQNIESRPLWKPMHLQPIFKKHPSYLNGLSEKLFQNGLCLPSGSNLNIEDKNRIVDIILKTINK